MKKEQADLGKKPSSLPLDSVSLIIRSSAFLLHSDSYTAILILEIMTSQINATALQVSMLLTLPSLPICAL